MPIDALKALNLLNRRQSRILITVGYALFFLLCLVLFLFWRAPLSWVSQWGTQQGTQNGIGAEIQLVQPTGTLRQGGWQGVEISGQRYPLTCEYSQQWHWRLRYHVACESPFALSAEVTLHQGGITVANGQLTGQLAAARPWLDWLQLPAGIDATLNVRLARADIRAGALRYLSVEGQATGLQFFDQIVLNRVDLATREPQLSEAQDIVLTISADEALSLFLQSEIDGKRYRTSGQLTGEAVAQYAPLLSFFGRQVAPDTLEVRLQGRLLP